MKYLNITYCNILKFAISSKRFSKIFLILFLLLNNVLYGLNDNEKKAFIENAWEEVYNNPKLIIDKAILQIENAKQNNDSSFIAELNRIIGSAYLFSSEYQKSIDYFFQSLEYYYSKNDYVNIAHLYNDIGLSYIQISKIEESKKYFSMALDIFSKNNLKKELATVQSNLGYTYFYDYNYPSAVRYYLQALAISDKLKDEENISMVLTNIAVIYRTLKNYDHALEYYNKAKKIIEKTNNLTSKSIILNNIANIHLMQKNYDNALNIFNQTLEIKKKINNQSSIAVTLNNIGMLYESKGNMDSAYYFYNQSLKIKEKLGNYNSLIHTNDCIARLYYKQNDLKNAELFFRRSVELGRIAKVPTREAHFFLAEIYKDKKDYEKLLYHLSNISAVEDTVLGPDKVNEINELLANYEKIKRDEEITNLSETNKLQEQQIRESTIFIVALVLVVLILIIMFIAIYRYSKEVERSKEEISKSNQKLTEALNDLHNEIETRKKVENDLLITQEKLTISLERVKEYNELKTKFISMISHEYRNPLTIIMNATELLPIFNRLKNTEQHEKYVQMIRQQVDVLVKLLNDVLILGKIGSTKLKPNPMQMPLVDVCKDVITNTSFIDENKHNFVLNASPDIGLINTDIQYLNTILSNLLLNSIKYSPLGTDIVIEISVKDDFYKILIKDKGIGIPENDKPYIFEPFHRGSNIGIISGNGLGLSISKMFLEELGGTLEFDSKENFGTTFYITIPKSI